jgi:hypothetical protein
MSTPILFADDACVLISHIMDIHMTQVNLAIYGKGVYHMAVRIYNALPNTEGSLQ